MASFFKWIGSLMRRFFFPVTRIAVAAPVTPSAPGTPGALLFNLPTQSGLLALLEDI